MFIDFLLKYYKFYYYYYYRKFYWRKRKWVMQNVGNVAMSGIQGLNHQKNVRDAKQDLIMYLLKNKFYIL